MCNGFCTADTTTNLPTYNRFQTKRNFSDQMVTTTQDSPEKANWILRNMDFAKLRNLDFAK